MNYLIALPYTALYIFLLCGIVACILQGIMIAISGITWSLGEKKEKIFKKLIICAGLFICTVIFEVAIQGKWRGLTWGDKSFDISLGLLVLVLTTVLIAISFLIFHKQLKILRNTINPISIKESIDTLPVGIAYSRKDGRLLLANEQINNLSYMFLNKDLQDMLEFWDELSTGDNLKGCERISYGNRVLLRRKSTTWEAIKRIMEIEEVEYMEIMISDITETDKALREIEKTNLALEKTGERIKKMDADIENLHKQEELLDIKSRFHDSLGQGMTMICRHLEIGKEDDDIGSLLDILRNSIEDIRSNKHFSPIERIEEIRKIIKYANADLNIEGRLPDDEKVSYLLTDIMKEAVTNAIKHGKAKHIRINIKEIDSNLKMIISNDGEEPDFPIKYSGGLSNIYKRVKDMSGEMKILVDEIFILTVNIPLLNGSSKSE